MKRTTSFIISLAALVCICLISCKKESTLDENNNPCTKLAALHAHPFTPVTKGEQIDISVDSLENAFYSWTGPGYFQSYSQNNTITSYADYSNIGWYYVTISYDGCDDHFDSVYVDVKFPQGTAPCSPSNNSATFNSALLLGDQSYYFVSFGSVSGGYGATCNSTNGDLNLTLSPYWLTHELADGIYYTSSNPLPEYADIDKVYISDVNQSIFWVAEPNKPVYISHVGGKQRITFCDINFTGDWGGTPYNAMVDAQITQP